jgi:hypothetical protein
MTTATKTTLPRRALPKLNVEPVLVGAEQLDGELGELSKRRKEAIRKAVKLRSAADAAARQVEAAAEQDQRAFREASLEDKPDPGRRFEVKAQGEAEKAHREAEGATLEANALADELRGAVKGEAGAKLIAGVDARTTKAQERFRDHLELVEEDIAEMAALTALAEQVERARQPNRTHISSGRGPDVNSMKQIHVNGGGNTPAGLVALLKGYDPRREQ